MGNNTDPWTDADNAVLDEVYPSGGAKAVYHALNGLRTEGAIRKQAKARGVQRIWSTGEPRKVLPRKPKECKPTDCLFKPNVQKKPISSLDRIALYPWGYITRAGNLVPIIDTRLAA